MPYPYINNMQNKLIHEKKFRIIKYTKIYQYLTSLGSGAHPGKMLMLDLGLLKINFFFFLFLALAGISNPAGPYHKPFLNPTGLI